MDIQLYCKAIRSLTDADFSLEETKITWITQPNPPVTQQQIDAQMAKLQAEYDAKQYQRDRARAYPSIEDQLDTLYHGGYDAWKATIEDVKNQYPKP